MALDATIGGASSNSYVTVAEAETYFENRLHSSAWETADLADTQEPALITATKLLDWYISWKGCVVSNTQALKWPRSEVVRPDGTEVGETVIPQEVKVATMELALSLFDADRTADGDMDGISKIKVGPLAIESDATSPRSSKKDVIPDKIHKILKELKLGSSRVVRLIRA